MRYVVLAEEDKSGCLAFQHFGGYWRLAPKPLSALGELDSMRANLGRGALIQTLDPISLKLAGNASELVIETLWNGLREF